MSDRKNPRPYLCIGGPLDGVLHDAGDANFFVVQSTPLEFGFGGDVEAALPILTIQYSKRCLAEMLFWAPIDMPLDEVLHRLFENYRPNATS